MIVYRKITNKYEYRKVNLSDIDIEDDISDEVTLTMVANTGGSVSPTTGDYDKYSYVPINAIPDEGNQFVKWMINGVENLSQLTSVYMDKAKTVIATFSAAILSNIMQVFNTAPVQVDNEWRFINNDGNADNYVKAVKTTIATFRDYFANRIKYTSIEYENSPNFKTITKIYPSADVATIYNRSGEINYALQDWQTTTSSRVNLLVSLDSGTVNIQLTDRVPFYTWVEMGFNVDNAAKTITNFWTNLETGEYKERVESFTGVLIDASVTNAYVCGNNTSTSSFNGDVANFEINKDLTNERIVRMQNLNGIIVYNSANNKIQDGVFDNANIQDAYTDFDETGLLEPYAYTKGATIYSDDSAPTDVDLWKVVIYSEDGTPALSSDPTGYTKIADFPAGSGILLGIRNEYKFNESVELIAFFAEFDMGVITTPKTFAELEDWADTDEIVKEYINIDGENVAITKLEFKT